MVFLSPALWKLAFCCLALKEGFLPGSANVSSPDPEIGHLHYFIRQEQAGANFKQ